MLKNIGYCVAVAVAASLYAFAAYAQGASLYSALFAKIGRLTPAIDGRSTLGLLDLKQILDLHGHGTNAMTRNSQIPGIVSRYQSLRFNEALFGQLRTNNVVVEVDRSTERRVQRLSFDLDRFECTDSAPIIAEYRLNQSWGPGAGPGASEVRYERNVGQGNIWLNAKVVATAQGTSCATSMGLIFGAAKNL